MKKLFKYVASLIIVIFHHRVTLYAGSQSIKVTEGSWNYGSLERQVDKNQEHHKFQIFFTFSQDIDKGEKTVQIRFRKCITRIF